MKLEKRVQEFILKEQLLADNANVLIALSGGADSVALLRMLIHLGYRCHAVHCNFHLRGEESDRDERFVRELCHKLQIPCEVVHFDTREHAAKHHISIEMAARELRYKAFERIRQERCLDAIAVAHHQDDAVETLLLNLIRGAGINGLTGMRTRNGYVVRPLLCAMRDEILAYLDHSGQSYITDSSNLTDEYSRNKIRLHLLPLMEQINPAARANIQQAATHLAEAATIYHKVIAEEYKRIVTKDNLRDSLSISIPTLLSTDAPKAVLFEILHPYGFNSAQIADVFRSLSSEAGRMFHTTEYTLLRDRAQLLIQRRDAINHTCETVYTLPQEGTLTLPDDTVLTTRFITLEKEWEIPRSNDILCIDADRLTHPLTIRHPREADRFHPFGMRGSKLLSDFYTNIKLPRTEKPHQWIVCHDNDIVWAVGHRSSERYRINGNESRVLIIEKRRRQG